MCVSARERERERQREERERLGICRSKYGKNEQITNTASRMRVKE